MNRNCQSQTTEQKVYKGTTSLPFPSTQPCDILKGALPLSLYTLHNSPSNKIHMFFF